MRENFFLLLLGGKAHLKLSRAFPPVTQAQARSCLRWCIRKRLGPTIKRLQLRQRLSANWAHPTMQEEEEGVSCAREMQNRSAAQEESNHMGELALSAAISMSKTCKDSVGDTERELNGCDPVAAAAGIPANVRDGSTCPGKRRFTACSTLKVLHIPQ